MATAMGARVLCASTLLLVLAACSNGRGSVEQGSAEAQEPAQQFSVAVSVAGLEGSGLVLQNNGGDDVTVATNGAVLFTTRLSTGAPYNVTILTQPANPAQTCTVTNGAGTIAGSNITNITVSCASAGFRVGGTVQGLTGTGLVLQNNGGDDLTLNQAGEFAFASAVQTGAQYSVSVRAQPTNPAQTCTVTNGTGTVASSDVTNVSVTCAVESFTLGGRVQGLLGSGLQIQNNGGTPLAIAADGNFTFPESLAAGSPYNVTVGTQPSNPLQSCAVENATGTVSNASITNVVVTCTTNRYTIGGTISGLAGSGLRLEATGGGEYRATTNGPFQFPNAVASGTSYSIIVEAQPSDPSQTCRVANDNGTVADANITNVEVTCTTERFTVGGRVNGLVGSGLVLRNNDGADLPIASNGAFTFTPAQESGTRYEVRVAAQPINPLQICTVAKGTGTVGGRNVTDIRVDCATQTFSIAGSVNGLLGSGLVLQNNGADPVEIQADGAFAFPREIASGATYEVTVRTHPTSPVQSCAVANGTGTVVSSDIANVAVSCTTSSFALGGTMSGLAGSGLVISNGIEQLTLSGDGPFTFATPLPSGTSYSVTVIAQPINPAQVCTVTNGAGVVGGENITSIAIACVTSQFTIGGTVSGLVGAGLVIQNNGGPPLPIAANGPFTFPESLAAGSAYNVTVAAQPVNPTQACVVSQGIGTVSSNVTTVLIDCTTPIPPSP